MSPTMGPDNSIGVEIITLETENTLYEFSQVFLEFELYFRSVYCIRVFKDVKVSNQYKR